MWNLLIEILIVLCSQLPTCHRPTSNLTARAVIQGLHPVRQPQHVWQWHELRLQALRNPPAGELRSERTLGGWAGPLAPASWRC